MQKRIIALAVAAAISSPAFADSGDVNVYGEINLSLDGVRSDNVAAGSASSQSRVSSNASRLGVKGSKDLGKELKGVYQLEVQVDGNGNANNGLGNGTRNSHVGLQGNFGTVSIGIWDTPYKIIRNEIEVFGNTTFASAINVLGRTGQTGTNFNNRLKNSVQYWSPNFNGIQVKLAYGVDNAKTSTINQTVSSLSVTYENELFYAAYAYENFYDTTGTTNAAKGGDKIDGNRLVGAYKFDGGLVGLTYERLSSNEAGVNKSRSAVELAGKYSIGDNNFGLSYVRAGDLSGSSNSGANQISLRYGYRFSKDLEFYGLYTSLGNKPAGTYNLSGGTTIAGSAAGARLSGVGAGLIYSFSS